MILKNILPFEKYVLTTKLSNTEVLKRIGDNIQQKQRFSFSIFCRNYTKPYTGQIIGTTFTMSRNISYRNSFLPIITGQIITFPGQTQVNIKMRPVTIVLIFISFWLGIAGLACIRTLLTVFLQFKQMPQNGFSSMLLIPFAMFAFGCLLIHVAFKGESKNSKEFLASLLEGIISRR
jgi:hypothetical protein